MKFHRLGAVMAGAAACALVMTTTVAGAATITPRPPYQAGAHGATKRAALRKASPRAPLSPPAGYAVVASGFQTATNGQQSHGSVTCPGTEHPTGGGAFVQSAALSANMNSSYPYGQSWDVDVNNTSGADTVFQVYAVCVAHSLAYTVVTTPAVAKAGTDTWAAAFCPTHTVALGGGVLSSTFSTEDNVNSDAAVGSDATHAEGTIWQVDMNNGDTVDHSFTAYAICRPKPKGYSYHFESPPVYNPPGTQIEAVISCPGGSVPLGGGVVSGSWGTLINVNTSYPTSNGWTIYQNNASGSDSGFNAQVVCAGT